MYASQKKSTEDKYEADLRNKIRSLKTRLQVMTNNVVQEKQDLKQNVVQLQQVKKKRNSSCPGIHRRPIRIIYQFGYPYSSNQSLNQPHWNATPSAYRTSGIAEKEETEIKEDLVISYEFWEGVRQVAHNMKLELGDLKIKQNTNKNS